MPATAIGLRAPRTIAIEPKRLEPNPFSLSLYGDPATEVDDLLASIREHGILVAMVVAPGSKPGTWEVLSGHRRLACALALGLAEVPCEVRRLPAGTARHRAILEYNRQRRKTFSQLMREADALEELWGAAAGARRRANLRRGRGPRPESADGTECRNPDSPAGGEDSDFGTGATGDPPG